MNPLIESYLNWTESSTQSISKSFPAHFATANLLISAESAYTYAHEALNSLAYTESRELVDKLLSDARYLALLLGSTLFDSEKGGCFAFTDEPDGSSLFGIGLGWLPLAVMLGCELDSSVANANINGALNCRIPSIDYQFVMGSAAAKILSLDDIKKIAMRQIEYNAKCSEEDLVDYLGKVAEADWFFAIADAGDSLLIAEGM